MKILILGGGIAAISLAKFLQNKKEIEEITILEKDDKIGGLLRSYRVNNIFYDVGPHIIFSRDKKILNLILKTLGKNKNKIRRSNKILYDKNTYIKYPFENELYKLPKKDLKFALNKFLNNKFTKLKPKTMKEFFLKNFGEGIFNLYLGPYNNKIWKMNTAKLDTQMVERIPRPPDEDIINSAKGIITEGYTHQLYFHYPKKGGIQSLFDAFHKKLNKKVKILTSVQLDKINLSNKKYLVKSNQGTFESEKIFSTIPLNEFHSYFNKNKKIKEISKKLQYNSIIIAMVNIKGNIGGNNFALMVPNKNIIFHRISKLDFLGKNYSVKNSTTFQIEITYKNNSKISKMNDDQIFKMIFLGLKELNFIKNQSDVNFKDLKKFKYAYVIYNLSHRNSVDKLLNFYKKKGIDFLGRWGSWEYLNSDQVILQAYNMSKDFNHEKK
ncbi:protoporphyrinogen/coproporphyrinogen oxidase [Candidatus Pelagibacter bacterium nBUS_25]|uniref:protoporphyrinogen/coproporphyrinogen oxidase n=1 Tax=Candidatus Pelagibacter bacterium nBUS_25 TaxID=3374187 RepID=UPI003EBF69E7